MLAETPASRSTASSPRTTNSNDGSRGPSAGRGAMRRSVRSCLPAALQRPRLLPALVGARRRELRHPDGRRRRRLAGLRRPPPAFRPRSGRALRVPADARCWRCRPVSSPTTSPGKLVFAGAMRSTALVALLLLGVTINGRRPAVALPRARGGQRASPGDRLAGGPRTRRHARAVGAAAERAGAALDRVPERNRRRAGARRAPLRDPIRSSPTSSRRCCSPSDDRGAPGPRAAVRARPARRRGWRRSWPASASSVARPSCSARSRSTCLRCCSAVRSRCCRSSPSEILHTGPLGLGVLRSAPAVGALLAGVMLTRDARRRPYRDDAAPGRRARSASSMIVFGLSKTLPALRRRPRGQPAAST